MFLIILIRPQVKYLILDLCGVARDPNFLSVQFGLHGGSRANLPYSVQKWRDEIVLGRMNDVTHFVNGQRKYKFIS